MYNRRVMIIDDDIDTLSILEFILLEEGYEVTTMTTPLSLQDIKRNPPALILLDIWLGTHLGQEFCRLLKSDPQSLAIPVVLISAINQLEETSQSCKADGFINKPFDIYYLITQVGKFVNGLQKVDS